MRVMLDCHKRLLESDHDRPIFPSAGDRLWYFKILGLQGLL